MQCENCKKEIKEKKEKVISIKNRFNNKIIYESKTATTIKECLIEAIKNEADLSEADLWKANLSKANLSKANLVYCKMTKDVFKQITENWFEWKIGE